MSAGAQRFASSTERLSTGLRLTRAATDAAGSALATKHQAQTLGWNRAQQNIQDGFSLAQVADTTFATLNDLVGRIRELATQSANGVYSDAERAMLQTEVDALRSEISQVIQRTSFNGVSLMEGTKYQPPPNVDVDGGANALTGVVTFDGVALTAGAGDPYLTGALDGASSAYGTEKTKSGTYEVVITNGAVRAELVGGVIAANLPAGVGPAISVSLTGSGGTAVATLDHGDTTGVWLGKLNAAGAGVGVVATLEDYYGTGFNFLVLRSAAAGGQEVATVTATAIDPLVAPEDYLGIGPGTLTDFGEDLTATVNGAAATVASSAAAITLYVSSPGNDADGLVLTIDNAPLDPFYNGPFPPAASAGFVNVEGLAEETLDLQLGIQAGPDVEHQQVLTIKPMTVGAMALTGSGDLGAIDISTQSGALAALDIADDAHEQIGAARAALGATWNALQQALSVAGVGEDASRAADSRLSDTDIAAESTELIKAQLQTQSASAAMAHMHADAARTLQLISEAEVQLQISAPEPPPSAEGGGGLAPPPPPAPTGGGAPSGSALAGPSAFSGSTFAAPSAFSGSAFADASSFGGGSTLGGYTPQPVTPGYSAYSVTPGFEAVAVTPGYTPLPVLGSKSAAEVAAQISGLSSAQMFSMIAGGIAA